MAISVELFEFDITLRWLYRLPPYEEGRALRQIYLREVSVVLNNKTSAIFVSLRPPLIY